MNASPSGRITASLSAPASTSAELAVGMDLTLESTQREIDQVRVVLDLQPHAAASFDSDRLKICRGIVA